MSGPEVVRTPEAAFAGLPGFPWTPRYLEAEGLRLAYLDEGDGPAVVLWHGEPTWSFLWRKVIPPLLDAGLRVIAPDLPGFGRSDKPVDRGWYSYDRFAACGRALVEALDLRSAAFVVHDWGGPIGLRVAVDLAERVDRIVVMDTGISTGRAKMSEAWHAFHAFVERTEDLPVGMLVRGGCHRDPGDEVVAAYDAPFPDVASKAGARAMPGLIPLTPEAPGAEEGRRVLAALQADERPTLVLWGEEDPVLPLAVGERFAAALGAPPPEPVPAAGHFLQEDAGETIGRRVAGWLTA